MHNESDKQAFLLLMQQHKRLIYKICNSYCENKNDRDDLAQEIVYQLWKSYDTYNATFKFSTWMYRVALNVAISFYRKEKRTKNFESIDEKLLEIDDGSYAAIEENTNIQLMHAFIAELREIDKSIIILYLEDHSYKEIGAIIGLTETNVATRINRIKEILKFKFSTHK
jgi:RNA polymerase sigma-70 factor (ECF subfamily)